MTGPVAALVRIARVRELVRSGRARTIRKAAGVSQAEVAAGCAVTAATLSRWERGEQVPRGEAALRYGEVLAALADLER